jgi:hypothetical protein
MLLTAFIVLTLAVLLGSALALLYLRNETGAAVPWAVSALHGLLGAGGLVCLMLALRGPARGVEQGTASFGVAAAGLIALAVLLGSGIVAMRFFKRSRAGTLIGVHAAFAVGGFVLLAAYLMAG